MLGRVARAGRGVRRGVRADPPRLSNPQTKLLATRGPARTTLGERALTDAKAVVDSITFGLTEEFVRNLALTWEHFRLAFPKITKANTPSPRGDDLRSAAVKAAAAAYHDLDIRLYDHAVGLLRGRTVSHCSDLLTLGLDDAKIEGALGILGKPLDAGLLVGREDRELQVRGWVLLAGEVADAVLIRVHDRVTPVVCRAFNVRAANQTHRVVARFAGVRASAEIPEDVEELEVIAFDRARGRRGAETFELTRDGGRAKRKPASR